MPDRQAIVGKTSAPQSQTLTRDAAWAYAQATNDQNPRYDSGAIAPPMFAVVLEMPATLALLKDPETLGDPKRFLRLLHGEQDMRFHERLVPGRVYDTSARIESVAEKNGNEVLVLKLMTVDNQKAQVAVETTTTLVIRGEAKSEGVAKETPREPEQPLVLDVTEAIAADQSLRYADASGDHNPIHKDAKVAEKAGLPGIILHGLCSMALCQKAIVNTLAQGEPERLKRLKVRFSKPVLNGQTLHIRAWEQDSAPWSRSIGFEAQADSGVVLKDGLAELVI